MKKLLILLLCLCLTFFVVACKDPVDSDTDTDSNVITDSDSDAGVDSDSDTQTGAMYKVTVVDQDGNKINGAKIVLLDEFDEYDINDAITTNEDGVATFMNVNSQYVKIDIIELPEYHINTAGKVELNDNNREFTVEITNNEPNGTLGREYNLGDDEEFEITIEAGKTVYYAIYGGGGRTFTLEGAEGIDFTFDGATYEASEDGIITFVIPTVDYSSLKRIIMLKNLDNENDITVTGTIVSPEGSADNPFEAVCGEKYEATIEKGTTVYYEWVATETCLAVITSESEGNDIYMQNQTSAGTAVSDRTDGGERTELNVTKGDVIRIFVSSKLDDNYSTVEFTLTVEAPQS